MPTWSTADLKFASYAVEGVLAIAFAVGLYYAGIEAYNIRLYAIKTFGALATIQNAHSMSRPFERLLRH